MSDLRTRIAAVLAKVVVDKNLDVRHHDLYEMADAVIAELGLRQEIKEAVKTPPKLTFTRYVTEWEADDETD
jgi:hypothetical protein